MGTEVLTQLVVSIGGILLASCVLFTIGVLRRRWKRSYKSSGPLVISLGFGTGDPIMDEYLESRQQARMEERDRRRARENTLWRRIGRIIRGELD